MRLSGLLAAAAMLCPVVLQAQATSTPDPSPYTNQQWSPVMSVTGARHAPAVGMRRQRSSLQANPPVLALRADDQDQNLAAVGFVIGAVTGGVVSYKRCRQVGCDTYVPVAMFTVAGGALGAAIGWIAHNLSTPRPPTADPSLPAQGVGNFGERGR